MPSGSLGWCQAAPAGRRKMSRRALETSMPTKYAGVSITGTPCGRRPGQAILAMRPRRTKRLFGLGLVSQGCGEPSFSAILEIRGTTVYRSQTLMVRPLAMSALTVSNIQGVGSRFQETRRVANRFVGAAG